MEYKDSKLRKICTERNVAQKKYSHATANLIRQRISTLQAIETESDFRDMLRFQVGGCHPLEGDREDQYSMRLEGACRLVFIRQDNFPDGTLRALVIDIERNYH